MATGMVFVIVTRHIDLSVGSLLATCSAVMAMVQTVVVPQWLGLGLGTRLIARRWRSWSAWPLAAIIGAFHGWLVGYLTIPAFIVTLGGLFVWRNVAWYLTNGQTIGPLDETFCFSAASAARWARPVLDLRADRRGRALLRAVLRAAQQDRARNSRSSRSGPRAPGGDHRRAILGFVAILNAYEIPRRRLERMFEARGEVMPEGYTTGLRHPLSRC
jgi:D-xylose transport system permease protein